MEPVCKPMAMDWQMPFASSRGYGSLTLQHDIAKMLIRWQARTGQSAVVYFISDLDPGGIDLQRAWVEALENFGAPVKCFERIAVTPEQVSSPAMRQLALSVKPSDSRLKRYVDEYGERCWDRCQALGASGRGDRARRRAAVSTCSPP